MVQELLTENMYFIWELIFIGKLPPRKAVTQANAEQKAQRTSGAIARASELRGRSLNNWILYTLLVKALRYSMPKHSDRPSQPTFRIRHRLASCKRDVGRGKFSRRNILSESRLFSSEISDYSVRLRGLL